VRYCSYFSLPLLVLFLATQESPGATNVPVVIPRPPVAPGLAYPVTVTTNESGVPVHQFSMKPAITNMAVATNDLAQLKAQLAGIEAETQKTSDEAGTLRKTMRNDYREIVGVMTNFTARNEEGKKLQDRITALETELKTLKQDLQKKMDDDEAYKQAKAKIEADREAYKKIEQNTAEIRKKRADVGARVWQLQTMVDRTLKEEEARANEAKAEKNKSAGAP